MRGTPNLGKRRGPVERKAPPASCGYFRIITFNNFYFRADLAVKPKMRFSERSGLQDGAATSWFFGLYNLTLGFLA